MAVSAVDVVGRDPGPRPNTVDVTIDILRHTQAFACLGLRMATLCDYSSSAARAFREHYDKLVDSIQEADLPVLGARFFSRQIISRETMEMVGNVTTSRVVRASKLMLAVMAGLDIHPDKFESVLAVLREDVYSEFSGLIMDSFRKYTVVTC